MPVPEFILRNFFVKGSFTSNPNGFSFTLINKIIEAHIESFSVICDDNVIPSEKILIQTQDAEPVMAAKISPESPFCFTVGTPVEIHVLTKATRPMTINIDASTLDYGPFAFSINTGNKNLFSFASKLIHQQGNNLPNIDFPDRNWEAIQANYQSWFAHDLDRPLVILQSWGQQYNEFIKKDTPVKQVIDRQDESIRSMHYFGDAFPRFWPNFGAGVVAAFLGSQVQTELDTAWFFPLDIANPFRINFNFQKHNHWWKKALIATRKAIQRWGRTVSVGITDLGGNLDILASLLGSEKLLTLLIDDPDLIDRATADISQLWLNYYDRLAEIILAAQPGISAWGPLYFPGRGYYLQSDFSYMISPKMFERWVVPDLEKCCHALDFSFYHLDGKGQICHLDALLAIKELHGIQWVPGDGNPPPEEWLPLLAKIRNAGKLCEVGTTRKGALKIVRELGGKGFVFEIQEYVAQEEALSFLDMIHKV